MSKEELNAVVQGQMKSHFAKKASHVTENVLPPMELKKKVKEHEIKMHEANKKTPKWDWSIDKLIQAKKAGKKDVAHLGQQGKQSIDPLVVLIEEEQGVLSMMNETGLTYDQILGRAEAPALSVADVWHIKYGESIVRPYLTTQVYRLNKWYMKACEEG